MMLESTYRRQAESRQYIIFIAESGCIDDFMAALSFLKRLTCLAFIETSSAAIYYDGAVPSNIISKKPRN